jgi:hypothetical protein
MWKLRSLYEMLVENHFESGYLEDEGGDGRVLLKWILWK